jgi:hypothetical protein
VDGEAGAGGQVVKLPDCWAAATRTIIIIIIIIIILIVKLLNIPNVAM